MKYPKSNYFEHINTFVHDTNVQFEEMQAACLGIATELEKYRNIVEQFVNDNQGSVFLLQKAKKLMVYNQVLDSDGKQPLSVSSKRYNP